jgi:hypothetical protein
MLRRYLNTDYETVKVWADMRKFPLLPQEYLPVTGFIHEGFCVGFLYKTDSKIAWLEWVISNPFSDSEKRNSAMNEIIEELAKDAKEQGFKVIFTSVEHKGLIERYKTLGFEVTDKTMTNMIGRL